MKYRVSISRSPSLSLSTHVDKRWNRFEFELTRGECRHCARYDQHPVSKKKKEEGGFSDQPKPMFRKPRAGRCCPLVSAPASR